MTAIIMPGRPNGFLDRLRTIQLGIGARGALGVGLARQRGGAASPLLNGLVRYFSLNETSGSRTDSCGNANATEIVGTTGSVAGKLGNAASFVTTNQLGSSFATNPLSGSFSVTAWVRITAQSDNQGIVTRFTGDTSPAGQPYRQFALYSRGASGNFAWMACAPTLNEFILFGSVTYQWQFLAGVYDSTLGSNGSVATYSNGSYSGPWARAQAKPAPGNGDYLRIGGAISTISNLNGAVDEVGLWNRPLSQAELDTIYNSGAGRAYPFS